MVLTPYFLGSDAGYSLHLFKQSIKLANFPVNQFSRGPEEWRNRTIYQLLTDRFAQPKSNQNTTLCASNRNEYEIRRYCGGTFVGIAEKLDYIKDLGFDAIWISPVVKQFEKETQWGVGWHGYWAQDLYTINEHFGTKKDLKRLVAEAHKKGIWVMVDVVANHMGPQRGLIPGTKQYVESYIPFNRTNHYHDYCVIGNDWDNQYKVEHCSLGGEDLPLPDLDTVVNVLWCYERFTVDDSGFVKIGNVNGEAKVLYPVKQLTGTGICNL
ncbi:hypothetical protein G9A89_002316 [Geosiphon pyriformis]|nr:hypothetical protein G9A89_002316 [Geosiphon pyriformis]